MHRWWLHSGSRWDTQPSRPAILQGDGGLQRAPISVTAPVSVTRRFRMETDEFDRFELPAYTLSLSPDPGSSYHRRAPNFEALEPRDGSNASMFALGHRPLPGRMRYAS